MNHNYIGGSVMAQEQNKTGNQLENLLEAWLEMEMSIRGNRVLTEMSFNEMIVAHIILVHGARGEHITATDLCDRMHLLKSQMNAMLTSMESRGYVTRVRSSNDRRKVYVELTEAGEQEYRDEHVKIIAIMQAIIDEIGTENIDRLASELSTATRIYQQNVGEE